MKGITMSSPPIQFSDAFTTDVPNSKEAEIALQCAKQLAGLKGKTFRLSGSGRSKETVELPAKAIRILSHILRQMGNGNALTVFPTNTQLTTQQAADLLGVSRPFLVKLLETGAIPFHKVGTHRRVIYEDVFRYKADIDSKRREVLAELTKQAQDLDLGY